MRSGDLPKERKFQDSKGYVVEAITFDDLVRHGRVSGAGIVNGMPWSFDYMGWHVTHENDRLYLICHGAVTLRLTPEDVLQTHPDGHLSVCSHGVFERLYEEVKL